VGQTAPCFYAPTCSKYYHRQLGIRNSEWQFIAAPAAARDRRILRAVVYVIVAILIFFLAFCNLIFGIKFDRTLMRAWIISVFTGLFTGAGEGTPRPDP
jgi:hypothetical protein